ncbi:MAG: aminotransferase class V-fold PLP-dependent enzyme [Flammeovirgaceae bacterium]|nr:aminotransferase class V-fold PLP-dependent enzyme [Flammeovirgaceae bacterium]
MEPRHPGFLFIRKEFQELVQPVFMFSGLTAYSASSGTRNVSTIIGLGLALDFHKRIGTDKIQQRTLQLRNYCLAELKKLKGLKVISPESSALSSGIVSFSLDTAKNSEIYSKMKDRDIIVKLLTQHNAIRISCHMFVSKKDIDTFIKELTTLLN